MGLILGVQMGLMMWNVSGIDLTPRYGSMEYASGIDTPWIHHVNEHTKYSQKIIIISELNPKQHILLLLSRE